MADEDSEREHAEWLLWLNRVFGSVEAWKASLPSRIWIEGTRGWTSIPR